MHLISSSPEPVLKQILYANPPAFISAFELQQNYILWSTTALPLTVTKIHYQTGTILSHIKKWVYSQGEVKIYSCNDLFCPQNLYN